MAASWSSAMIQFLCIFWFLLDLCWTVAAETFCARNCTCTNLGDSFPVWPEAVAGGVGAAAPLAIGGAGYLIKKIFSPSKGKLNVSNPREGLIPDYDRKGSLGSEPSMKGFDPNKRRQSTLTVFDNEDDDFLSDDEPGWSSTPRGVPMSRPSFM